jgi:hypothetical protein
MSTTYTISAMTAGRKGYRATTWTAGELAEAMGPDLTVFVSFGHVGGVERFGREHMVRNGDHMDVVVDNPRDGAGRIAIKHPMSRELRILVK